jgi:DNA modification methylase
LLGAGARGGQSREVYLHTKKILMVSMQVKGVKMEIAIRCKGNRYLNYEELKDFQGDLKKMPKESLEKLKKSILQFGWVAPVFVWNGNYIIDGHGRLKALREIIKEGHTISKIPVVDIEAKTKEEAGKILLAINSHYQEITEEGLQEFVTDFNIDIEMLDDFILPDVDINKLINNLTQKDGAIDDDEVPEVNQEPITKYGDLYILGNHRVLCGDATKMEDIERLMDGKKADMVFTDPPYNVNYSSKNEFLNKLDMGKRIEIPIVNDNIVDYISFCNSFIANIKNFLNDYNSVYITFAGKELLTLLNILKDNNFYLSQILVWVKNNIVLGRLDYLSKHELIIYGWWGKHKFYGKSKQSVWEINKPLKSDLHPTMKPIKLVEEATLNSSQRGNIVLDPFLGSGTTLIACEQTNRICYGIEKDTHYCDVIVERWCQYTGIRDIIKNGEPIKWEVNTSG